MSESFVRLNPIRMIHHIQHDTKWQKLTTVDLLSKTADEVFDANLTKVGDDAPEEEITARRLIQNMEQIRKEKVWKDKGLAHIQRLAREELEEDLSDY